MKYYLCIIYTKTSITNLPKTLTFTKTAFSPAALVTFSVYFPESSLLVSEITRNVIVSMISTRPFLTTLSIPILLHKTLGAGLPLTVATSLIGHPALTVKPFFSSASKSISGVSVCDIETQCNPGTILVTSKFILTSEKLILTYQESLWDK